MKIATPILIEKLIALGLMDENSKPITFAQFKKLCDIHQYGHGNRRLYIIFIRNSKDNMVAFYPPTTNRPEMLKICYEYLLDTIQTEMKQEFLDGNIQWGNCGIPIAYGNVRAII